MYTQHDIEELEARRNELIAHKADVKLELRKKFDLLYQEELKKCTSPIDEELDSIRSTLYQRKHYVKKHGGLQCHSRKDWTPEQLREYNRIKKQESRMRQTLKGE